MWVEQDFLSIHIISLNSVKQIRMNNKLILLLGLMCLVNISHARSSKSDKNQKYIYATDFGAVPNDGKDDTKALRRAAEYCRTHPGTTLNLPSGIYRLRDTKAEKLEEDVLKGKMGANPEKTIFTPYYPYVKGLDFEGASEVIIEAHGATLMCEGWMEPLSIVNCRNVTVRGLTVDYKRKPFSEGVIKSIGSNSFTVQFDEERPITKDLPITRMTIWDDKLSGIYAAPFYFPERHLLGNNLVRFNGCLPEHLLGAKLAALHSFHFRPAILIHKSINTSLEYVTIHSQPGMGIVGFDSKDIMIRHLSVEPADGYTFSTNTDATHFACCEGVISLDGCSFRGQGDDATNVHGYYHNIAAVNKNWVQLDLQAPTYTHAQVADVPRTGDKLELVRISTLEPIKELEVIDVAYTPKTKNAKVRLKGTLPPDIDKYYLFNATKLPKLEFCRSIVWGQLARGVLVKTREAKITDNIFRGCTGTAIHIGAESNWKEGTHTNNITITGNIIVNCGLGAGTQYGASGIAVVIDAPDTRLTILHNNIRIADNTIIGTGKNECGIVLRNIHNVWLENNHIEGCKNNITIHAVKNISQK